MSRVVVQACLAAIAALFSLSGCSLQHAEIGMGAGSVQESSAGIGRTLHPGNPAGQTMHSDVRTANADSTSRNEQIIGESGKTKPENKLFAQEVVLSAEQEATGEIETIRANSQSIDGSPLELSSTVDTPADSTGILYSPANGVVSRVLVDVGDRVRAGQVVAFVNSPDISDAQAAYLEAVAKLSQSKAQLETVKARLELSKANERRVTQLNEEGIAAKKDIENARSSRVAVQSEEAAANGAMGAALASLQAARVKLGALGLREPATPVADGGRSNDVVTSVLPIRSPVTGVVVKKDVFAGQSVGPSTAVASSAQGKSASLMTVADLRKVWVMLEVPQREVAKVKLGSLIDFRSESVADKRFIGRITRLAESFDPQSRTAHVRAEIDNPGELLKPGMLVIATLSRGSSPGGVPCVPPGAVQTIMERDVVFVSGQPHHYKVRVVTCGERSPSAVEINAGLQPGETVVTRGAFYLKSECLRGSIAGGASGE